MARVLVVKALLMVCIAGVQAQTWQRLGPEGGMVLALGANGSGTLFLGTSDGHVFASEDHGQSWSIRGRVGIRTDAVVSHLVGHPQLAHRLYASVWYQQAGAGGGVFRSEDDGVTWIAAGLQGEAVRAIELAPSSSDTLIAGTLSGVFRSVDSGRNWERISPAGDEELRNVDSVAIDPADANVIYAGTYHLPWKTLNGGKTWQPVVAGLIDDSDIMSMRVDALNPSRIYLSACSGIYRSENRGELWTKLQGIPYSSRRTQAIVQDEQNPSILFAATTEGLWITRDAGESWERTTPRDWVVNAVWLIPARGSEPGRILIGTEAQGVLISRDNGKTFVESNRGFTHRILRQLIQDPSDRSHLLLLIEKAGNALLESHDGGRSWAPLETAAANNGKSKGWSASSIAKIYGTTWGWMARQQNGTIWLFSEKNQSWKKWIPQEVQETRRTKGRTVAPKWGKEAAPSVPEILGSVSDAVYLSTAGGLYRCNLGASCSKLPAFASAAFISAFQVSDDGKALLVLEGTKLARSHDSGATASWSDLPAAVQHVYWMDRDSHAGSTIYLGTEYGLYFSANDGTSWTVSNSGLPAGRVEAGLWTDSGLVATLADGALYRSLDGVGNWSRLDRDTERGRVVEIVKLPSGGILFGSQSEGLLLWTGEHTK